MSDYRDDVNETGIGTDATWIRLSSALEETARGRDQLYFRLRLMTEESGVGSDQYSERVIAVITENAVGTDQYHQQVRASNLVTEKAKGRDTVQSKYRTLLVEQAVCADALLGTHRVVLTERGFGFDEILGQRRALQLVSEQGKGCDALIALQRSLVEELAQGRDAILGRVRARDLLFETGQGVDEVMDIIKAGALLLTEHARGHDELWGRLHANDLVGDAPAVGWDELLGINELIGQAWTADASAWAMSRYAPFGFSGLAVINDTVYALAPDGVYALDGDAERIRGELRTGLMDMTGDVLALPVESHVEYELSEGGKAWVDVTQTQAGKAQTYAYPLKGRPLADTLTNARFEFGRGLRGRHFAYTLRLEAERAHINDWSVLAMPSKRSL